MMVVTVYRVVLRYYKRWRVIAMVYHRHERGIRYRYRTRPDGIREAIEPRKNSWWRRRYSLRGRG